MRLLLDCRPFSPRCLFYVSRRPISYKETLNMPKSPFASTMKNRLKNENEIRQVCSSVFFSPDRRYTTCFPKTRERVFLIELRQREIPFLILRKSAASSRDIRSVNCGIGKPSRTIVDCLFFTTVHPSRMDLFIQDTSWIRWDFV